MPGWIIPALSLGLSAGSSLFNISQSLKSQRDQKEQFREQMRQRATDLRTQATNYSGDTNAMLRHLFGEGGVTASMEDTQKQLDRYYNDAESQLQNLFNYAGMSGPRADVMVDQLRRQREEDLEALGGDYSQQLAQGQQDILNTAYNTYQSRLDAQGGGIKGFNLTEIGSVGYGADFRPQYTAAYIPVNQRVDTFFDRNSDFIEGAVEMARALREGKIGDDFLEDSSGEVREAAEWGKLFNKIADPNQRIEDIDLTKDEIVKLTAAFGLNQAPNPDDPAAAAYDTTTQEGKSQLLADIRHNILQENAKKMGWDEAM